MRQLDHRHIVKYIGVGFADKGIRAAVIGDKSGHGGDKGGRRGDGRGGGEDKSGGGALINNENGEGRGGCCGGDMSVVSPSEAWDGGGTRLTSLFLVLKLMQVGGSGALNADEWLRNGALDADGWFWS